MGRRRDLPSIFAAVGSTTATPVAAVLVVGAAIAGPVRIGNVQTTWSCSAFSVLIDYATTNHAALQLNASVRLFPRVIPALGLGACLFLACWVERTIWMVGLGLIGGGLVWHVLARRFSRSA